MRDTGKRCTESNARTRGWNALGGLALRGLLLSACGLSVGCAYEDPVDACDADQLRCGPRCVSPDSDPRNCGGCAIVCDLSERCAMGSCVAQCPSDLQVCEGTCVATQWDPAHCGGCSGTCASDQVCVRGGCAAQCPSDMLVCDGRCIATQWDPAHCGSCTSACEGDQVCANGACAAECPSDMEVCDGRCVATRWDPSHCGSCSDACGTDQVCVDGGCATECPSDMEICGGRCVATKWDPAHCGSCSGACGTGEACVSGVCSPACPSNMQMCDNRCVATEWDPEHCGNCSTACESDQICANGACATECPSDMKVCDGRCVATRWDPAHCGSCSGVCGNDQVCVDSVCTTKCPSGMVICDGRCVATESDSAHCGGCAQSCPTTQHCSGGACVDPGSCRNQAELCNGVDDDCDSLIDEDFRDDVFQLGQSCANGVGACRRAGNFVCASNLRTTVCDAVAGSGTSETCNDEDDNCDGVTDYTLSLNGLVSACQCHATSLLATTFKGECGEAANCDKPVCSVDGGGLSLGLSYHLGQCTNPFPWAQCRYNSVSLNDFDADHLAVGESPAVLAVSLRVSGLAPGQVMNRISLYYGNYPGRKHLAFFSDADLAAGVSNGAYTRYFRPWDATCPPEQGLHANCLHGCPEGRWADSDPNHCLLDFDRAPLWITAEGCRGTEVTAQISNVHVQLLKGPACVCLAGCFDPSRPTCDRQSPVSDEGCAEDSRCAGVCVP